MTSSYSDSQESANPVETDDHGEDHATERAEEMIARGERPPHYIGPMPGDEDDPNRCEVTECDSPGVHRAGIGMVLCADCFATASAVWLDYSAMKLSGNLPSYVRAAGASL